MVENAEVSALGGVARKTLEREPDPPRCRKRDGSSSGQRDSRPRVTPLARRRDESGNDDTQREQDALALRQHRTPQQDRCRNEPPMRRVVNPEQHEQRADRNEIPEGDVAVEIPRPISHIGKEEREEQEGKQDRGLDPPPEKARERRGEPDRVIPVLEMECYGVRRAHRVQSGGVEHGQPRRIRATGEGREKRRVDPS